MSSIFILEDVGRDNVSVKIIEMDRETNNNVDEILQIDIKKYKANAITFDGSYKPEKNECLKIDKFDLFNEIREAINNPLGVEKLIATDSEELNIRAVFLPVQENETEAKIIFQRIQKRQILLGNQFTLFWDKDTFISTKKPGIVITDSIDAYYEEGTLYFKSYYWANQIFNLNKYYREATDEDIREFCSFNCFYIKDLETVIPVSNNWTRRKIAYILDSKVLENNSLGYIVEAAKNLGVELDINEDSKIVFPKDTTKQRELLSYLADEIYKGSLTEDVYLTNSKRILR